MNSHSHQRNASIFVVCLAAFAVASPSQPASADEPGDLLKQPGLVKAEFIYEKAPFPECHASTLAETRDGLVAAWFGGTRERDKDVGIWLARQTREGWSTPVEVANGVQDAGTRYPCWNPVLFQPPKGPLLLFYKVGPSPSKWWGMVITSSDSGKTWTNPRRLPEGMLGPIKNKPILLPGRVLLCPSSTEHDGWRIHFERTADMGQTWERIGPIDDEKNFAAIQPTILSHGGGKLQALCRTKARVIAETWSSDGGKTWSPLAATTLPNPNSGIDAVTLRDGRHLLVYNPTKTGRTPLYLAVSKDGKTWQTALVLEKDRGEYSYPAVIQTADGLAHISYTWKRQRVRHVVVDPAKLVPRVQDGEKK